MRTTLEIEDDVLAAAKEKAKEQGTSLGRVVSQALRQSLEGNAQPRMRNGIPLFESTGSGERPDLAFVNALRDEE